ncbi:hypothetical protein [Shewanella aestuarii]|uniref:Uncharacterized protein n=1 Tax=Shewanella aestuarii TaxID=1028752 RepID=A0A6G9QPJ7_9GAMM|nr:hypothetical protein [Shewanella aestuarii]QIR16486.1 hypothetical protein HBH39_19385 [Shewanella aestuarii]
MQQITLSDCLLFAEFCSDRIEFNKYKIYYDAAKENYWLQQCYAVIDNKVPYRKEAPAIETPAIETPAIETPAIETPAIETPDIGPSKSREIKGKKRERIPLSFERCVELAKQCQSRSEFHKKHHGALVYLRKNKRLQECYKQAGLEHKYDNTTYTFEDCVELAKQCQSRTEFHKKYHNASAFLIREKRLDDCFDEAGLSKFNSKYSYETCVELAKQCATRDEFNKKHRGALAFLRKINRHQDCFNEAGLKSQYGNITYTFASCVELAKQCQSRTEFHKKYPSASAFLNKKKRLEECFNAACLPVYKSKHTYESCVALAKQCTTRVEFSRKHGGAFGFLRKINRLQECYKEAGLARRVRKADPSSYTFASCVELAKQCQSRTEFHKKYPIASSFLNREKRLDDCFDEAGLGRYKSKYSYEKCVELAKHCATRAEFSKKNGGALTYLRNNNLIEKCFNEAGLVPGIRRKDPTIYTFEICVELAKQCATRSEFNKKYGSAAAFLYQEKRAEDCFNEAGLGDNKQKKTSKYTYEICVKLAKQCANRTAFIKKYGGAAEFLSRENRLEECFIQAGLSINKSKYSYEGCVGLAKQCQSRSEFHKKYGSAAVFLMRQKRLEDCFVEAGLGKYQSKFSYEKCVELAKHCATRTEFYKKHCGAYIFLIKNNRLDECFNEAGLRKYTSKYSYDVCLELAKQCATRAEFNKKHAYASKELRRQNRLEDCFNEAGLKQSESKFSYEVCVGLAKQCESRAEFNKKHCGASGFLTKNNRLEECFNEAGLSKYKSKYSYEVCLELAKQCATRAEFNKKHCGASRFLIKNNRLEEFFNEAGLSKYKSKLSYEVCVGLAKQCKSRGEFYKKHAYASKELRRQNRLEDCFNEAGLKQSESKFSYEVCVGLAKQCKSRGEFARKHYGASLFLRRINRRDECFAEAGLVHGKLNGKLALYTFKSCVELAKQCQTRSEFRKKYTGAISYLYRHNKLEQCYAEAGLQKTYNSVPPASLTFEYCVELAKQCNSCTEFSRKHSSHLKFLNEHELRVKCFIEAGLKRVVYSYKKCLQLAKECDSRSEFVTQYPNEVEFLMLKDRLDECMDEANLPADAVIVTYDECVYLAKQCLTRDEFSQRFPNALRYLKEHNRLDECYAEAGLKCINNDEKPFTLHEQKLIDSVFSDGFWKESFSAAQLTEISFAFIGSEDIDDFRFNKPKLYKAIIKNGKLPQLRALFHKKESARLKQQHLTDAENV